MDKDQIKLLLESAEEARRIKDEYGDDFVKIKAIQNYNSQIPFLAQQIAANLPKIDLLYFAKSIQFTLPEIDYSLLIPKIDYSQLIKNFHFPLPKIDSSLLAKIYSSQISSLQKIAIDFARIHAPDLAKIRANAFLMTSAIEGIKNIADERARKVIYFFRLLLFWVTEGRVESFYRVWREKKQSSSFRRKVNCADACETRLYST